MREGGEMRVKDGRKNNEWRKKGFTWNVSERKRGNWM